WDKLSPKQREEFSTTMKELLRASYAQKALGQGQAKTEYGKEKVQGNEAEVHTALVVQKDRFPVVYKLYRLAADSEWRIFDVVTDEVSLLETYRGQFRKLIAQRGYDGLLETLKQKRDQLAKKSAQTLR
ncbi:MAG: ABC transporter substrate-binding protein, partial [Myxococcaceae bacterium]